MRKFPLVKLLETVCVTRFMYITFFIASCFTNKNKISYWPTQNLRTKCALYTCHKWQVHLLEIFFPWFCHGKKLSWSPNSDQNLFRIEFRIYPYIISFAIFCENAAFLTSYPVTGELREIYSKKSVRNVYIIPRVQWIRTVSFSVIGEYPYFSLTLHILAKPNIYFPLSKIVLKTLWAGWHWQLPRKRK